VKTYLAAAALVAGALLAGQATAASIIFQDFEGVNVGSPNFYTEYSYRSGAQNTGANSMYGEGTWTINDTPFDTHDMWLEGSFASNKLILNGKDSGQSSDNTVAWRQEAAATAGKYAFSFDVFDVCCNANFYNLGGVNATSILTFEYQIDGGLYSKIADVKTNEITNFSENGFDGYRISGTFNVAPTGTLRVSVRSWQDAPGGNDFAIDNISITAVPEPTTWGLMILGFGAAGSALRRRRTLTA
jgi:hypothetical protein